MSDTSSASPNNLEVFVSDAGAASGRLEGEINKARATIMDFYNAPCDGRFRPKGDQEAFNRTGTLLTDNHTDEAWIKGVRQAFVTADTNTLPDAAIASSLQAAGINATAPTQLTVNEPVYQGAVMYSGWTDDPVSTGAGHFLEVEEDLTMPEALRVLAWTRTYSSRFVREAGMGRGWYSWAGTRLDVGDDQVVYYGPDGQVAPFARTPSGLLRHPAMEGQLIELDSGSQLNGRAGGFELRWRWTARFPGMVWTFHSDGRLHSIQDPFGGTTTAEHEDGQLATLTHQGGRQLSIRWNAGRVAEVLASDGRRVVYHYEGDDLIDVDRPAGAQRYGIGGDGRVAEVFDADGVRLVRNEYDADGRVLTQESPFGRVSRYRYIAPSTVVVGDDNGGPSTLFRHDHMGRVVEMQLADGSRSTRRFDDRGNPVQVTGFDGVVVHREFDIYGNCVTSRTLGGAEERFAYDDHNRLIWMVDALGAETRVSYEGDSPLPTRVERPLGLERTFEHLDGLVVATVDSDGVATRYERDADGQIVAVVDGEGGTTRFGYHPSGAQIERVLPTGETERWEVDGAGRTTAYVSGAGARTERTMSPAGRVVAVEDGTGATCRFEWGQHGEASAFIDPLGEVSRFTWDELGNRVAVSLPEDSQFRFEYDPLGRLAGFIDAVGERWDLRWAPNGAPAGLFDPLGQGVAVEYDLIGRTVTARSAAGRRLELRLDAAGNLIGGSADDGGSTCAVPRDVLGRITSLSIDGREVGRWTYTPGGLLASLSRPDGSLWQWAYDRAGRPLEVRTTAGVERAGYDASGRLVRLTEATGERTEFVWDADGQLAAVTEGGTTTRYRWDAAGRLTEEQIGEQGPRRYGYDPRGSLVEVVDPLGGATTIEQSRRGLPLATVGPSGERWSVVRDPNDRIVALMDPLERQTRLTLDPSGRVAAMTTADGREYRYDRNPDGMVDAVRSSDRQLLAVARDLVNQETVARDDRGRVSRVQIDGTARVIAYDDDGALTRWEFDDDQRRVAVTAAGLPPAVSDRDPEGRTVRLAVDGLDPVVVERDGAGRVTALRCGALERQWERDSAGRPVTYIEHLDGETRRITLERDADGRLVRETAEGVERRYIYDGAGQLVGMADPQGTWVWEYDASGRLVWERGPAGDRRFVYDDASQLRQVEGPGGTVNYTYDERGRRVLREGLDGVVRYQWDDFDRLIAVGHRGEGEVRLDLDPLGQLSRVDGQPAGPVPAAPPGELAVRASGHNVIEVAGSPVAEMNGSTRMLSADWRGNVGTAPVWGPVSQPPAARVAVGYLGELEIDGLVWLRNRVYDPDTHSFLSRDPLGGQPGWPGSLTNPYVYAFNDPIQWQDPLGLKPVTAEQASQQMDKWKEGHWKEMLITAAAVGLLFIPGVGELALPLLIGAAAGAGGTIINAYAFGNGHIDWGEVVMNAALGAVGGGAIGPLAGVATKALGTTMEALPQLARMGINTGIGGTIGAGSTAADLAATNHPITLENELIGFAGGAAPGLIPTKTASQLMNPEARAAMESWLARHPNAVNLPRGSAARLAAAGVEADRLNSVRVQPVALSTGTAGIGLNKAQDWPTPAAPVDSAPPAACAPPPAGFVGPVACR